MGCSAHGSVRHTRSQNAVARVGDGGDTAEVVREVVIDDAAAGRSIDRGDLMPIGEDVLYWQVAREVVAIEIVGIVVVGCGRNDAHALVVFVIGVIDRLHTRGRDAKTVPPIPGEAQPTLPRRKSPHWARRKPHPEWSKLW